MNDPLEHEADRVADRVVRIPEPHSPSAATAGVLVQRKCAACREEEIQRCSCGGERKSEPVRREADVLEEEDIEPAREAMPTRVATGEEDLVRPKLRTRSGAGPLPSRTSAALRSIPGELRVLRSQAMPLPAPVRSFYESRMGFDFGGVRIHRGPRTARTARALNARAYTLGRDVVFGAQQYDTGSAAGRRLLAHELAHVVQQGHARPLRGKSGRDHASAAVGPQRGMPARNRVAEAAVPSRTVRTAAAGGLAAAATAIHQAECCGAALSQGLDGGDYGGVICCNGVKHTCVWQGNINARRANTTARGIIGHCVRAHENTHLDDVDCTGAAVERPPFRADRNPSAEECTAYRREVNCYNRRISGCGTDEACLRDVRADRRFARQQIAALC